MRQKIDHGLEDVEAGRTLAEEEFDQRMAKDGQVARTVKWTETATHDVEEAAQVRKSDPVRHRRSAPCGAPAAQGHTSF